MRNVPLGGILYKNPLPYGSKCIRWDLCIGYTLKARWLSDLFNRVPKARGE